MKFYLIGIKGAGVSALALILKDLHHEVVGYDDTKTFEFTETGLIDRKVKYFVGEPNPDLTSDTIVIRSSAIKDSHPEIVRANELGCEIYDLFEYIGKLTKDYDTISISGCHGKTTTTAMITKVMKKAMGVNYYIGDGSGRANPKNKVFIAEACEYRRHFMSYDSNVTVITNIDNDHLDYFTGLDDIKNTFTEFANKTHNHVIACGDDKDIRDLNIKTPVLYYGVNENNDILAKNIEVSDKGMKFDVYIKNELFGTFDLPLFGSHQLENTLAVIGVCYLYNISPEIIQNQLHRFKGAARRFAEVKIKDNIIVDDYAHHSSEVLATIKTARQKYPNKNLVVVFEPHSFNRVVELNKEFAEGLNLADKAYVLPIYPSRDNPEDYPGITSDIIINQLDNGELIQMNEVSKLNDYKNTVFLFMSLKEIHELKDELIKNLKNK